MKKRSKKVVAFKKVLDETHTIHRKYGGGLVKMEAWEDQKGNIVKYSLVYINPLVFAGDNGRVIGYDNTHAYHHKHYMGETFPVEDFVSYEDLEKKFEQDVQEVLKNL